VFLFSCGKGQNRARTAVSTAGNHGATLVGWQTRSACMRQSESKLLIEVTGLSKRLVYQSEWPIKVNCLSKWMACYQRASLIKVNCLSKWMAHQSEMHMKVDGLSTWNTYQSGLRIKVDYVSKWITYQSGWHFIKVELDCLSKWLAYQREMPIKVRCLSKWMVYYQKELHITVNDSSKRNA